MLGRIVEKISDPMPRISELRAAGAANGLMLLVEIGVTRGGRYGICGSLPGQGGLGR
jgi:hypothetical protein